MAALKFESEDPYELFKSSPNLKIYYFIGRLNPPHEGHIAALTQMIEEANASNSVALILLGSGPFEGERTMDNPISYESKVDFLRYKLPPHLKYEIRQMTKAADDVTLWYQSILSHIESPSSVEFIRFAGDKDGNLEKSSYMEKTLLNRFPTSKASATSVKAKMANAKTAKSATAIRKFVYEAHIKELEGGPKGFDAFREKYHELYLDFTQQMYDEILYPILHPNPASENPESRKPFSKEVILQYIEDGTFPKSEARKEAEREKREADRVKKLLQKSSSSGGNEVVAAARGNAKTARNSQKQSKSKPPSQIGVKARNTASGNTSKGSGKGGKETKKTTPASIGEGPKKRGGGTKKYKQKKSNSK